MGERRANAFTVSPLRPDAPVQLRERWAMAGSMETSRTTRVQGRVLTAATPPALCKIHSSVFSLSFPRGMAASMGGLKDRLKASGVEKWKCGYEWVGRRSWLWGATERLD